MSNKITKKMILLAGYPATGKSYLCQLILQRHPTFETIDQDTIKEKKFDELGFDTLDEKVKIENEAWNIYYQTLEIAMRQQQPIISDYPFSQKQKSKLERLATEFNYDLLTIRLVGEIEIIYQRSRKRDLDKNRHLGHLVSHYHKGDRLTNREEADCLVDEDTFINRCLTRAYDKFQLGSLIEVDVTDFSKVNYEKILKEIDFFLI